MDAILGGFRNIEGVDLRLRGLDPRIIPVDRLGVPTYDELVLVARRSTVEDHPEAIRAFIEALARGTDYARAHPQEAANAVISAGKGLDPMQTRAEVAATLPLLAPPQGKPYGYLDPNAWRAYARVDGRARPDLPGAPDRSGAHGRAAALRPGCLGLSAAAGDGTRGPWSATRRWTSSTSGRSGCGCGRRTPSRNGRRDKP